MVIHAFIVKVLFLLTVYTSILCSPSSAIATTPIERPTHLVSIDYSYGDDKNQADDTSGQESLKIENRQLYDTVKHASGYDPDANNNSRSANEETNEKLNSSSVKIYIPPRKSAVIQAIPRKIRGPGSISSSTTTSSPFARPPSLHATAKDYGTGEPTTTIVYATSIPTSPSRTYVNIRPVPLLSTQKYRSTVIAENQQEKKQDTDNIKPVVEKFSVEQAQPQPQEQKPQVNVLEKPAFKIDSNSEQATTTPRSFETTPYHVEQRKRNLYKSIPYARIRTNEDIEEMPAYNRNAFVNPYPNHKWTNEDYGQRMPPPASPQFVYENHQNPQQNYYQPSANQNIFSPRYPAPDDYQDEMYRGIPTPSPVYVPQHQPIATILSQQRQQYQPLTVRDFDLLLQLLVLRERRLHSSQEPYSSPSDYSGGIQQDSSYYYDTPKAPVTENQFYKNIEPKYIDSAIPRSGHSSNSRLLPSNVREELLFRMLLLALHLQPQPKPLPMARSPPQYMFLGSSPSQPPAPISPASAFLGFRQRSGVPKTPVRSVQVLGEIE